MAHDDNIKKSDLNAEKLYLPTLDGWRATAIVFVLLSHSHEMSDVTSFFHKYHIDQLGVSIFFSLSGFLICSRLVNEFLLRGHVSLKNFYIRRVFRIFPAAIVYLFFLGVLDLLFFNIIGYQEILSSVFFVRNYIFRGEGIGYYTNHFWTLAVEEHFYVLFPVIFVLLGVRKCLVIFPFLCLISVLMRNYGQSVSDMVGMRLPGGVFFWHWTKSHVRMDSLLWGCWWALFLSNNSKNIRRYCNSWFFIISFMAVIVGCNMERPESVFSIFLPVIIVSTVFNQKWILSGILESRIFVWLGRISYSLYLWQQLFFVMTSQYLIQSFEPFQQFPLNIFSVFGISVVSFYFIEKPLIRFGRKVALSPRPV